MIYLFVVLVLRDNVWFTMQNSGGKFSSLTHCMNLDVKKKNLSLYLSFPLLIFNAPRDELSICLPTHATFLCKFERHSCHPNKLGVCIL